MKLSCFKRLWLMAALLCCVSCRFHHYRNNINITLSESDRYYKMEAYFPEDKTYKVQQYMDEQIAKRNNTSFTNARIDGNITLDDKTNFYIKLKSGELKINLDKQSNSYASYKEVKQMCEGLKKKLGSK